MKYLNFRYFLKSYIVFFSALVIFSAGLIAQQLIEFNFEEMFKRLKSLCVFLIFLLLGIHYQKIQKWLELNWK